MNGFFDFYTILFLVLAVVIFLRLRSVLGRRTGNERQPFDPFSSPKRNETTPSDKVVNLPPRGADAAPNRIETAANDDFGKIAPQGSDLAKQLSQIKAAEEQGFSVVFGNALHEPRDVSRIPLDSVHLQGPFPQRFPVSPGWRR